MNKVAAQASRMGHLTVIRKDANPQNRGKNVGYLASTVADGKKSYRLLMLQKGGSLAAREQKAMKNRRPAH